MKAEKVKMKATQSCLILCDFMDCSLLASFVYGILQARILEWVAFPFSRGSSRPTDQTQISHIAHSLYHLSHQGSPRTPEWVAYPFSREIFPTQELNQGLLHCWWILYQLSYQRLC